jgi:hypothetical protein
VLRRFRSSSTRFTLAAAAALLACACATPVPPFFELPGAAESLRLRAAGYELPPVIDADTLVTDAQLEGPNHRIAKKVYCDDRWHVYTIESEAGAFHAWGDETLDARLREVAAIQAMNEMRTTEDFAAAAEVAGATPLVAEWKLISDPTDSTSGVPQEAWDRIHGSEGDRDARSQLQRFEHRRREIAAEFGVDPYSSNAVLRRELNRLVWAVQAGGLESLYVPVQAGADGEDDRMREILRQYSPDELERLNRIELRVMGVPKPLADEFVRNPWYTPRYATMLVADLSALDQARGRTRFIELAVTAKSENDVRFYQRSAELLRRYDRSAERIEAILGLDGVLAARDGNATLVIPHPTDLLIWSEATAALADSITRSLPEDVEVSGTELLLAGTASPTAHEQLESRGIAILERAFHALVPDASTPAVDGD